MTVGNVKFNPFSQNSALGAIRGIQTNGGGAVNGTEAKGIAQNPLKANNNYGVGLVNSDLNKMSYRLPNGETTCCNTIGIA